MKNYSAFFIYAVIGASLFSCQKNGGGGGSNQAPANNAQPAAVPYGFPDQVNKMSCGDYLFKEYVNGNLCSTQKHHYNTRAELCDLLKNDSANQNCAKTMRDQVYLNVCQNWQQTINQQVLASQTSCLPVIMLGNDIVGGVFVPVTAQPATQPISSGSQNVKLITCTSTKNSQRSVLGGLIQLNNQYNDSTTVSWNMKDPKSEVLSKLKFTSGLVKLDLVPGGPKDFAQMKLTFQKLNAENKPSKQISIQAPSDNGVTLLVQDADDQQKAQINCFMVQGQNAITTTGQKISCEGQGAYPSGQKFKISQTIPWSLGSVINQDLVFIGEKNDVQEGLAKVFVSATQSQAQIPNIQLSIPRIDSDNYQDLEVTVAAGLTTTGIQLSQKEKVSRFSLDLSCKLAQ